MTSELFAATNQLKAQTRVEFIRAPVALITFFIGCSFGLLAAAGARILDAIFAFLLYRPHLDRMTNTSLPDFVPVYGVGALLTGLAVAPAGLLMAVFRMSARTPMHLVLASVALGVGFWAAGLVALKHPLLEEIKHVIKYVGKFLTRRAKVEIG